MTNPTSTADVLYTFCHEPNCRQKSSFPVDECCPSCGAKSLSSAADVVREIKAVANRGPCGVCGCSVEILEDNVIEAILTHHTQAAVDAATKPLVEALEKIRANSDHALNCGRHVAHGYHEDNASIAEQALAQAKGQKPC